MHTEIGAFAAKARLSELLREVGHGQRYTITVRGHPVADLIPSEDSSHAVNAHSAVEEMRRIRKVKGISLETLSEWITEGRR